MTKHQDLQRSDADLQELLRALQNRPDHEASDILRRLRSKTDPLAVLNHVRDGELLLQASVRPAKSVGQRQASDPLNTGNIQGADCVSCGSSIRESWCNAKAFNFQPVAPGGSASEEVITSNLRGLGGRFMPVIAKTIPQTDSALGSFARQKHALKRKYADVERFYQDCNFIFSRIITGSEGEATAIFRSLRGGVDPSQIVSSLQNHDMQTALHLKSYTTHQQAILNSLVQSTASLQEIIEFFEGFGRGPSAKLPPMHGVFEPLKNRTIDLAMLQRELQRKRQNRLVGSEQSSEAPNVAFCTCATDLNDKQSDPPIWVPAWPWTRLTSDDAFVSRLINHFLSYHNGYLRCVEEDSFLTAMRSGRLDTLFCSPLLVNAICAYAAVYLRSIQSMLLRTNFKTIADV